MPLPPPPPGFQLDAPQQSPIGRPVIRRAPETPKPNLPTGYQIDPVTGQAAPVPGLPSGYTTPDAPKADRTNLPKGWEVGPNGVARPIRGLPGGLVEQPKPSAATPQDAAIELRNVMDKAFRAKELSRDEWFATGFGSGLAKQIGGTDAADVDALLDTIGASTAFDRLQKMRENSPTGGALGNITERELDLLKSTISSLKQSQSPEQFQGAMQDIVNSYGRVLSKLPGGRKMMIERGWLPKSGGRKLAQQPQAAPKVIDFNDLP